MRLGWARLASINGSIGAIQGQTVTMPPGSDVTGDSRVSLGTSGDLSSVVELENPLIEVLDLGLIHLGDGVELWREL
ncbi:hypothetical protein A8B78_12090 [Jannaschia sp. EhC01]|nr:hypothetical protein A8B78_12090 [Jannaschia sp. EhC01]